MTYATKSSDQHRFVYRKSGNFAAWPANGGIWHWGDEILDAFNSADIRYPSGDSTPQTA